jgi:hypothetical protein
MEYLVRCSIKCPRQVRLTVLIVLTEKCHGDMGHLATGPDVRKRHFQRHVFMTYEVCGADGGRPAHPGDAVHQALGVAQSGFVDNVAGILKKRC